MSQITDQVDELRKKADLPCPIAASPYSKLTSRIHGPSPSRSCGLTNMPDRRSEHDGHTGFPLTCSSVSTLHITLANQDDSPAPFRPSRYEMSGEMQINPPAMLGPTHPTRT